MGKWIQIIGVLFTFLFVGVPTIAKFYLPAFEAVFSVIPEPAFYVIGGLLGGWMAKGALSGKSNVTAVKGCVSKDGITFRGTAHYAGGTLSDIDVDPDPYCPNCQTRLEKNRISTERGIPTPSYGKSIEVWECPNCGTQKKQQGISITSIENIFRSHFEKISESDGAKSLESLKEKHREKHDEEPSETDIWEKYIALTDGEHLSTDCFH
jgi:rubredoxin